MTKTFFVWAPKLSLISSKNMSEYAQEVAELEGLVARATDSTLEGPEWALNMALCDCANARRRYCDDIVRFLLHRLQSGNPKVTLLALVLTETLVKNGPSKIHSREHVQNQALLLIQQWADAFKGGAFQHVYRQLKLQGVAFPEVEHDAPVFTPPSSIDSVREENVLSSSAGAGPVRKTRELQLQKLHDDLKVVQQKIKVLKDLYFRGQTGEELDDILDFLRQCQPRMNTLIEGGIMGKIDERTLEECLTVNDHLMKSLEECSQSKKKELITCDSPPQAHHTAGMQQRMEMITLNDEN
ncbi:putative VHS domain, GAT domain superfamily protein [Plasmopara halstedii]